MRKSRFTEEQIVGFLHRATRGKAIKKLCREIGVTEQTLYRWR